MNYLLLPGNPPAVYFYELWQREIMTQQPEAKARVSPYPLLSRTSDSQKALDEVLETHLGNLHEFYEKTGTPVTLIGHSLGGYFAVRLLERANEWIQKVILVHPFLRAPDLRGRLILNAVGALQPHEGLQKLILRSRKLLERFSTDLPHVTNEEILKAFHLGRHESATIARDQSSVVIRPEFCSKIQVFYTHDDSWCRPKALDDLKNQVSTFECSEPHGFITNERHRKSLFTKILEKS